MTLHAHNWKSPTLVTEEGIKTVCNRRRSREQIADTPQGISCDTCSLRILREGQLRGLNDDNTKSWTWADLGATPPPRPIFTKASNARTETVAFIGDVISVQQEKGTEAAMYFVYDHFDRWLCSDQFAKCDEALRLVDYNLFDNDVAVSFIGVTIPASDQLPSWKESLERVKRVLASRLGEDQTNKIFAHLT